MVPLVRAIGTLWVVSDYHIGQYLTIGRQRAGMLDIQQYTRQSTNDLPHRTLNDPPDIHIEKKNLFVRAWDLNPFYI